MLEELEMLLRSPDETKHNQSRVAMKVAKNQKPKRKEKTEKQIIKQMSYSDLH